MKIEKILSELGGEFRATLKCEHCGSVTQLKDGYHDNFYHTIVILGKYCKKCGKNRAGKFVPKTGIIRTDNSFLCFK